MALPSEKTARLAIGLWWNAETNAIHLSLPGEGLSTINPDPNSKRGHPHLYNKLAKVLRASGKPYPAIIEDWDQGRNAPHSSRS